MEWQPIETHDGRRSECVLYFPNEGGHLLSAWITVASVPPPFPRKPTHFIYLPAPPQEDREP